MLGKHRFLIIGVGLAASAVFLYLALRRLDFGELRALWMRSHPLPWIPLAILSYVVGHLVRGHRCRLLVQREASLGLMTASNIVVVGYASNNVFPARLGELVRAGMLAERTGIPVAQSLTITFIERILDGLAILLLLLVGTSGGGAETWIRDLVRMAALVFGAASVVLAFATYSPGLLVTIASRVSMRLGERWHDRLVSLATSIANAGACLRDPRDAARILALSVVVWICETGLFLAILPVFGLKPSFQLAAVAMSVTNLGLLAPSTPGFVGPFHFFCSRVLVAYAVEENIAIAYATLVHLTFYIPVTIWGAGAMLWYGVEVGATAALVRGARVAGKASTINGVEVNEVGPLAKLALDRPPSAYTTALVEAIVAGEGALSKRALLDTSAFVEGQLAALSPRLSFLLESGMTFFRFVTRLRYLRGYCDLPLETRRAWTRRWTDSRTALFRQLFKPVRAIALLAYADHPDVRASLVDVAELTAKSSRSLPVAPVEAKGEGVT